MNPPNQSNRERYNPRNQREPEHRINESIRVPEIRLVGDNFEEMSEIIGRKIETGVYPTYTAIGFAEKLGVDLVEITPNAAPPVCRLIDYNKFLYNKKKKEKELKAKTSKTVIKEIRFGPNTDEHDFEFKLKHAKSFLGDESAKVKTYVQFKGRAIVFKDRGELLLLKFIKELDDYGAPESLPKLEGKRMFVMIAPKKKK